MTWCRQKRKFFEDELGNHKLSVIFSKFFPTDPNYNSKWWKYLFKELQTFVQLIQGQRFHSNRRSNIYIWVLRKLNNPFLSRPEFASNLFLSFVIHMRNLIPSDPISVSIDFNQFFSIPSGLHPEFSFILLLPCIVDQNWATKCTDLILKRSSNISPLFRKLLQSFIPSFRVCHV